MTSCANPPKHRASVHLNLRASGTPFVSLRPKKTCVCLRLRISQATFVHSAQCNHPNLVSCVSHPLLMCVSSEMDQLLGLRTLVESGRICFRFPNYLFLSAPVPAERGKCLLNIMVKSDQRSMIESLVYTQWQPRSWFIFSMDVLCNIPRGSGAQGI